MSRYRNMLSTELRWKATSSTVITAKSGENEQKTVRTVPTFGQFEKNSIVQSFGSSPKTCRSCQHFELLITWREELPGCVRDEGYRWTRLDLLTCCPMKNQLSYQSNDRDGSLDTRQMRARQIL